MINTQVTKSIYTCILKFMTLNAGSVTGFVELGDINFHFSALEKQINSDEGESEVANSMLVLFVRGLFSKLCFAYAQFPCTSVSADKMYDPFWEAVSRLEMCGFKVMGLTCDGLAANRRLFSLHDPDASLVHKIPNPYTEDGRDLYFFLIHLI